MDNNTNQPAVGKEPVEQEDKQKKRLQNVLEYAESLALVFAVMLLIFTFIARPATVDAAHAGKRGTPGHLPSVL